MGFHSYKIELYGKNNDGSYKTEPVDLSEIISVNVNYKMGESADGFSFNYVNYNNFLFDQIKIDDRVKIYGTLDGVNYTLLIIGIVNEKSNTSDFDNKIITITGLNLLEKMFNSLVSTTGETIQRTSSYWIQNILQQVNEFNGLGNSDRRIYYTTSPGSTDSNDPNGNVYADATITQTSNNVTFTRDFEKAFKLIEELSNDDFTSDGQYYYYLDENNYFHYKKKPTTVTSNIEYGNSIIGHRTQKGMYNIVNYIIMNCGKSPYGTNILNFDYRVDSINKYGWKVKLITQESISGNMQTQERKKLNDWDDGETFPNKYPYTTFWGESATSDGDYNDKFVEHAWSVSQKKMRVLLDNSVDATYKSNVTVNANLGFSIGALHGLNILDNNWVTPYNMRLDSVNLRFNEGGWFTDLSFVEDTEISSV